MASGMVSENMASAFFWAGSAPAAASLPAIAAASPGLAGSFLTAGRLDISFVL